MARPRGKRKATPGTPSSAASLIAALKFINIAQKDIGAPNETHCVFFQHWAYASNGVLSAGHKIVEDLQTCPHTGRLLMALGKCGETLSMSLTDSPGAGGNLTVSSGKFRAVVPCIPFADIPHIYPDAMIAPIDERITKALAVVGEFATEGAQKILEASILLQANSAFATDRRTIIEYWHGVDLPPGMVVPKVAVAAILKTGKKPKGFGYSWDENSKPRSATFYFEDDSWIKTQLYQEAWPDCTVPLSSRQPNPWPLPKGFSDAIKAIDEFSEGRIAYSTGSALCSGPDEATGARYEVEGIPKNRGYNIDRFLKVLPLMETIDFGPEAKSMILFFGPNVRGAVAGLDLSELATVADDPAGVDYAAVQEASANAPPAAQEAPVAPPAGFSVAGGVPMPPA